MKIVCESAYFQQDINKVAKAAAGTATLPILQNIQIEASEDTIFFSASDLEVGMRIVAHGKVEEAGIVTLPAKTLSALAKELPKETSKGDPSKVVLESAASDRVVLTCDDATFTLNSLDSD